MDVRDTIVMSIPRRRSTMGPAVPELARTTVPSTPKTVTQEELAEAIGVSRVWLESSATIRSSTALLDRLSRTLTLTPEERAELFRLAIPELRLGESAAVPLGPANDMKTGTILDGLPPFLASAKAGCSAEINSAALTLARARQQYHQKGTPGMPTRSRIFASWNRCRKCGVDPDKKAAPYCGNIAERLALSCRTSPIGSQCRLRHRRNRH